jgi:sugar/nucleoside kinase (ribokinase family)
VTDLDVLVVGECNPDLVLTGGDVVPAFGQVERLVDEARLVVGASAAIMACGLARLGLRVALAAVVGDDPFARFMREALAERGVVTSGLVTDPVLATGVSVILSRGADRAILTAPGAIGAMTAALVDRRLVRAARHVHVASFYLQPLLAPGVGALLAEARAAGASTSLDTNWDPADRWAGGLAGALAATDVFLPNEEEALRITGAPTAAAAAAALADQVGVVAVKCGARGGLARAGTEAVAVAAPAVDVVDTTGAGDSFGAGFIAARLRGLPLADALRVAVACGTLSTREPGGTAAQPTWAEAAHWGQALLGR